MFEELDIKIADDKSTNIVTPFTHSCSIGCTGTGHTGCKPPGSETGSLCC